MADGDGLTIRDKIATRGIASLDDAELLAVVMGEDTSSPAAADSARSLLERYPTLSEISREETARLRMVAGLGLKRAERIAAATEFGHRLRSAEADSIRTVESSDDIRRIFTPILGNLRHEESWAVYLTASNRIIDRCRIGQGGVRETVMDQRLVVKRALELLATRIIIVHNHPSGTAQPSDNDRTITARIKEAAALFDLQLLDHIIIARDEEFSFLQAGLL